MPKQSHSIQQLAEPRQTLSFLALWQRLSNFPLVPAVGRSIFNFLIGIKVPYTGTVKPQVKYLEPGLARVEMKDRKAIRNHLNSVHAIALANMGEFASGIAMLTALPDSVKAIVTHLEIDYKKKARGTLIAEGRAHPPAIVTADVESIAYADIRDTDNDIVAEVTVTWQLRSKDQQDLQETIQKDIQETESAVQESNK